MSAISWREHRESQVTAPDDRAQGTCPFRRSTSMTCCTSRVYSARRSGVVRPSSSNSGLLVHLALGVPALLTEIASLLKVHQIVVSHRQPPFAQSRSRAWLEDTRSCPLPSRSYTRVRLGRWIGTENVHFRAGEHSSSTAPGSLPRTAELRLRPQIRPQRIRSRVRCPAFGL